MKTRFAHRRNRALTLTEGLVIIAVLAILAALFLPALAAAKYKRARISCMSNVKQIGVAFRLWGDYHSYQNLMSVSVTNGGAMELLASGNVVACFQVMSNELNTPKILLCPEDTHRTYATNFSIGFSGANISYFINADATEAYPQIILIGDNNLLVDGKPVQPGILNLGPRQTIAWTKDRHRGVGHVGMADGSAQQVTSVGLNAILRTSTATNRWLIS